MAENALRGHSTPIGVAEWTTVITESLPEELAASLPSIELLEAELANEPVPSDPVNQGEQP